LTVQWQGKSRQVQASVFVQLWARLGKWAAKERNPDLQEAGQVAASLGKSGVCDPVVGKVRASFGKWSATGNLCDPVEGQALPSQRKSWPLGGRSTESRPSGRERKSCRPSGQASPDNSRKVKASGCDLVARQVEFRQAGGDGESCPRSKRLGKSKSGAMPSKSKQLGGDKGSLRSTWLLWRNK